MSAVNGVGGLTGETLGPGASTQLDLKELLRVLGLSMRIQGQACSTADKQHK